MSAATADQYPIKSIRANSGYISVAKGPGRGNNNRMSAGEVRSIAGRFVSPDGTTFYPGGTSWWVPSIHTTRPSRQQQITLPPPVGLALCFSLQKILKYPLRNREWVLLTANCVLGFRVITVVGPSSFSVSESATSNDIPCTLDI